MTPHELLMPRYIVTAEDTSGNFKVGDIYIHPEEFEDRFWQSISGRNFVISPEKYPHLFRLLHWSEYRDISDMPEYIKCVIDCIIPLGTILKAKWESFTGSIVYRNYNPQFYILPEYFSPATEQEYIQYKQTKQL